MKDKFKVGDRVRIKTTFSILDEHFIGMETIIIRVVEEDENTFRHYYTMMSSDKVFLEYELELIKVEKIDPVALLFK